MNTLLRSCLALALLAVPARAVLQTPDAGTESPESTGAPESGAVPTRSPHDLQTAAPLIDLKGLEQEIDRSLRWLRSRQATEDGSYGDVTTTSTVLLAFSTSHRGYVPSDGPFISRAVDYLVALQGEDGRLAPAEASVVIARSETRQALGALARFPGALSADAANRALEFAGEKELPRIDLAAAFEPMESEQLRLLATKMLSNRNDEGYWPGPRDPVAETAGALLRLNSFREVLASRVETDEPGTASPLPSFAPADRQRVHASLERGAAFLLTQRDDAGLWGMDDHPDAGVTAMVLGALVSVPEPRPAEVQAAIDHGAKWLLSLQRADGSIHDGQLQNYVTSAAVLALARAGDDAYAPAIARARRFLETLQADEGDGYSEGDRFYGGVGYGGDERPDLSNLQMALEALSASGAEQGDESFTKALVFLQRCQNRTESNDLVLETGGATIRSGNDGGAGYAPGESKAGKVELADGSVVTRSYGSMTYALLKGYVFAGLSRGTTPASRRLLGVAAWTNYTLDVNPGFDALPRPDRGLPGALLLLLHDGARARPVRRRRRRGRRGCRARLARRALGAADRDAEAGRLLDQPPTAPAGGRAIRFWRPPTECSLSRLRCPPPPQSEARATERRRRARRQAGFGKEMLFGS